MKATTQPMGLLVQIVTSGRIVLATLLICSVLYPLAVLGIGQLLVPHTANGSLIHNKQGETVGSAAVVQGFTHPKHFWPRPSAVAYNASAAGGSNLSPTSPALRKRAETILSTLQAEAVPADLVTAYGSGLDPHITVQAARCQVARVAAARGISEERVMKLLEQHAEHAGGNMLVNVLGVNMALDTMEP